MTYRLVLLILHAAVLVPSLAFLVLFVATSRGRTWRRPVTLPLVALPAVTALLTLRGLVLWLTVEPQAAAARDAVRTAGERAWSLGTLTVVAVVSWVLLAELICSRRGNRPPAGVITTPTCRPSSYRRCPHSRW